MSRFCSGFSVVFRVTQLLLSLVVLGCSAFVTYEMVSMSSSAHELEVGILILQNATLLLGIDQPPVANDTNHIEALNSLVLPVLDQLQGTPLRPIILTTISFWSSTIVIYLLIARKANKSSSVNKRSFRVLLEAITLILWVIAVVCAALLAIQYGSLALVSGVPAKAAMSVLGPLIQKILLKIVKSRNAQPTLSVFGDLVTIGCLSILIVFGSSFCTVVSCVSLIMACCTSGKQQKKAAEPSQKSTHISIPRHDEKAASQLVTSVVSPSSWQAPAPPAKEAEYYNYRLDQQGPGGRQIV